jgi:hypothetical protein
MGSAQAGIHKCGLSIDAYTPSGSTASGARLAKAASCSLVPLTPHSLSTANVLFGSFSQGYTRSKGAPSAFAHMSVTLVTQFGVCSADQTWRRRQH